MKQTEKQDYLEVTFLAKQALDNLIACIDKNKELLKDGKALGAIASMVQLSAIACIANNIPIQMREVIEEVAKSENKEVPDLMIQVSREFTDALGTDLSGYN